MPRERDPGLEIALERAGGVNALARLVNRKSSTVAVWTHIPIDHVPTLERELNLARHEQRPDIYLPPRRRA